MPPKIDWFETFFSSSGRMGALRFTVVAVCLLLVLYLFQYLVKGSGAFQFVAAVVVYCFLVFCGACAVSKRLHDRGRSGWWAGLVVLAVVMVWPAPEGFLDFVAVLVLVWAVIDLCILPGERVDNRYGRTLYRPREA